MKAGSKELAPLLNLKKRTGTKWNSIGASSNECAVKGTGL